MKEIDISESTANQRLNKFLARLLPNANDSFLYKMLRKKNITLNGLKADGREILKNGDKIRIYFSDETYDKFKGDIDKEEKFFHFPILNKKYIVFEDENVIIINKPAGMLSQKTKKNDISACEYLIGYLHSKEELSYEDLHNYKPSVINRLDRNTTGILVCAKNLEAAQRLSAVFKDRSVLKEYICIVKGKVSEPLNLCGYLTKDDISNKVKISEIKNEGMFIETSYTPLKFCDKLNATVLKVHLKTGKTHQIRAHLSYIGHPIGGDPKYGNKEFNGLLKDKYGIKYQLLHAYRLVFPKMEGRLLGLSGREIIVQPAFKYIYEE